MMMGIVFGVAVMVILVGMFVFAYMGNQDTEKPLSQEELKTDAKGCFNINRDEAGKE